MRLRLATYNIQKAVGLDLRRDPGRIVSVLNDLKADVIALQEADRRLAPRRAAVPHEMIENDTDFDIVEVSATEVSLGWHGNAILVRRGIEVLQTERVPLPGLEPRGAVGARLRAQGAEFIVIGLHLGLLRKWRRKQLSTVRRHLDKADIPRTAIMGDFNEWSPREGIEALDGHFRTIAPGRSFHAARPMAALDRVALGRRFKADGGGVDRSGTARIASDHLPVWVDVELTPAPEARPAPAP